MTAGRKGACLICEHPASQFLNKKRQEEGEEFNAAKAAKLAKEIDSDFTFTRQTWYSHLKHITHPLVSAAEAARRSPVIVPKTNEGALEAIRDLGMQQIIQNPYRIDPDHTLKALSILTQKQPKEQSVVVWLAKVISTTPPAEIVEGEFTDVTPVEEEVSP